MSGLPILNAKQTRYAALPDVMPQADVRAVYVHVPFCTVKCHYCDFYSVAGHLDQAEAYLAALKNEMRMAIEHFGKPRPETIFIGGGTPTLLSAQHLRQLLLLIQQHTELSQVTEFTIEANPNTFCADRAAVLAEFGINRISFGAQSFVPAELAVLQRDHDPENVERAFALARAAGINNLNVDLIFGTPGQTAASWRYSLRRAIELGPQHVSAYSLIYEPNTAMTARMHAGEFAVMNEDAELDLFSIAYEELTRAGLHRYETSNHALPGRECRHNLHYWQGSSWLAWGPSAASGYGQWRWKNVQNLAHYLDALNAPAPQLPLTQMEKLTPEQRAGELIMLWLRLAEGINLDAFARVTGVNLRPAAEKTARKYAGLNILELDEQRIHLTDKGVPVSDAIVKELASDIG